MKLVCKNFFFIKEILTITILVIISFSLHAQQCTMVYQSEASGNLQPGYQYSQLWNVQNQTSGCTALNYYLEVFSTDISYDGGTTWSNYSGDINLAFYRTPGDINDSETTESNRFSANSGQTVAIDISFDVAPSNTNVDYRVFFDIFDGNGVVLPVLSGGRLYTDFFYNQPVGSPNLKITSPSTSPNSVTQGGSVTLSCNVSNTGNNNAGASTLQYWLCETEVIYSFSTFLGQDPVGSLTANGTSSENITVTIPNNSPTGNNYICFLADATNSVSESNENDNIDCIPINIIDNTPTEEITITGQSLNVSSANAGSYVTATCFQNYSNSGGAGGDYIVGLEYRLSTNCVLDASDILLDTDESFIGNNNTSDQENEAFEIPANTASGNYYILFVGDSNNTVNETNENNNVKCVSITIFETASDDFTPKNANLNTNATCPGFNAFMSFKATFSGNSTNTYFVNSAYVLSTNDTYNSGDIILSTDSSVLSASNSESNESSSVTIPSNTAPGNYFLLIVMDYQDVVAEGIETNNTIAFPFTVLGNNLNAFFTYSSTQVTAGFSVGFQDQSYGSVINSRSWTFESAGTSSSQNPTRYFYDAGTRDVTLQVTDICGNTDQITQKVKVLPNYTYNVPEDVARAIASYDQLGHPTFIAGDPVNFASGAYLWVQNDLNLSTLNGGHSWNRSYNSRLNQTGSMGWNWTHNFDMSLSISDDRWIVTHGDGHKSYFVAYEDNTTLPLYKGMTSQMYLSGGIYTFEKANGMKYNFHSNGQIKDIVDRNGNTVSFTFTSGKMSKITFAGGRYIDISYTGNMITSVTDNAGNTASYQYDASDNLVTFTNVRGGTTQFIYDGFHRIISVIDPNGNTVVQNTYDNSFNKVLQQIDAQGNTLTLEYNTPIPRATRATDALGRVSIYHHDASYRLTKMEDEGGATIEYLYDDNNNQPTSIKDKNGNYYTLNYDAVGNPLTVTDPQGNSSMGTFNNLNLPLTMTDKLGRTVNIAYNSTGQPTAVSFPDGTGTTATYNSLGQLTAGTDPNGNTVSFTYNSFGDVQTIITPTGTYQNTYDAIGRPLTITDRNGKQVSLEYDPYGNVIKATDAMGFFTETTYDGNGNVTSTKDKNGTITTLVYDSRDRLISVTNALGQTATFVYDALNNLLSTTSPEGDVMSYTYDVRNRMISYTNALGTYSVTYDNNGNRVSMTNALGNSSTVVYDNLNRPTTMTDALGNSTTITYNAIGQTLQVTDANGNSTQYTYNNMNRLITVTDALSGSNSFAYDPNGNMLTFTDANGHTTTMTYDSNNRALTKVLPGGFTNSFTYDNEGILVTKTEPVGISSTLVRDDNYRVTGITFSNGSTYNFTYDNVGRTLTQGNNDGTTTLVRNAIGQITQATDPFGLVTGFEYDGNGRRTKVTYPSGQDVTTAYNAVGLPTQVTDWLGNTSTRTYDANGQELSVNYSNGVSTNITRDVLGRINQYTNLDANNAVINNHQFTYDAVGNVLADNQSIPLKPAYEDIAQANNSYRNDDAPLTQGNDAFTNNDNGGISAISGDRNLSFTWGEMDLLNEYTKNGVTTQLEYNSANQVNQITKAGTTKKLALDATRGMAWTLQELDNSLTATRDIIHSPFGIDWFVENGNMVVPTYTPQGHTTALTDAAGEQTDIYSNDVFGAFPDHIGTSDQSYGFHGKHGIMHEGDGIYLNRARVYDGNIGRFVSRDAFVENGMSTQGLQRFHYAGNNPMVGMDVNGFYPVDVKYSWGSLGSGSDLITDPLPGINKSDILHYGTINIAGFQFPGYSNERDALADLNFFFNLGTLRPFNDTDNKLMNHFLTGDGSPLHFSSSSNAASAIGGSMRLNSHLQNFELAATRYYNINNSLDGFDSNKYLTPDGGLSLGHTYLAPYNKAIIGGIQSIDAHIQDITGSSIQATYTIGDHFGFGDDDYNRGKGISAGYLLQHYYSTPNKYQPFVWTTDIDRTTRFSRRFPIIR